MLRIVHFTKNKINIFSKFKALRRYFVVFFKYIQSKKQQISPVRQPKAEFLEKMLYNDKPLPLKSQHLLSPKIFEIFTYF